MFLDSRWLIDRVSCFRICCGWLDDVCVHRGYRSNIYRYTVYIYINIYIYTSGLSIKN